MAPRLVIHIYSVPGFIHCKIRLSFFPCPAGMSLTKLSVAGSYKIFPGQGELWSVTSRLGKEKTITFFYSVIAPDGAEVNLDDFQLTKFLG